MWFILLSKKGKKIILYDIHYKMLFYIINKEVFMDKIYYYNKVT